MDKNDDSAHFGEDDPEATDKEWEEFASLLKKKRQRQEQAFYPCPPPQEQDEEYVNTLVSRN